MLNPEYLFSQSSQESTTNASAFTRSVCPKCRQAKEAKDRLEKRNSKLSDDKEKLESQNQSLKEQLKQQAEKIKSLTRDG